MKKKILTYILIVLSFVVMAYAFVPQVLSGKIVNQSDISGHIGMSRETALYNEEHPSEPARWTGSMFSGMPTVSILNKTRGDLTQLLFDALQLGKRPASYLLISLLGAFLLMLAFGINPLIAVGGAIAITFCSFNFQIIQVGHNTKMLAIAFLPWVLAGVVFTYRKAIKHRRWLLSSLLGATLFALALSFQIKANHPQISWYLAVMILFYAVSELVYTLVSAERKKYLPRFFAASALLLAVGCVGIATNANKMLPLWEYSEYSIRGGSSSGTGDKGAGLEYATAWSYGWEELPNLVIPNYNGGSSSGAVNPDKSKTCDLLRRAGQKNITQVSRNLPLYWGPQPFTAGPMYLGAVTFFLFLLSLMLCRGRDKWWMIGVSLLAILLALGSNLMGFTRFFYEYVPMYSKWRTVTMSLVILQFTLPVLGFLALDKLVREGTGKTYARKVLTAGAVSVGFCLVVAVVQSLTGSFSGASDAGQPDILVDALAADRKSLLWKDTLRSVLFIAAAAGSLLIGLKIPSQAGKTFATHPETGRSRRVSFAIILSLILLVDGFTAGKRYLNADDFVSPKAFRSQFALRPVDKMILEDKDPSYRVLDLSVNVFNDSHPSYWHKNIGGYSPAKLRIYQDYIENHLSAEINSIYSSLSGVSTVSQAQEALPEIPCLSALNCRYIVVGGDAAPIVNPAARGNAWFESPAPGDSISLTSYSPDVLQYSYESAGGGKAVFSEVYYPAGWEATLEDGTILDISLSDEVLRSVELPAGKHELTMRFAPASYSIGENVSRASSILLILLLISCVSIQLLKP